MTASRREVGDQNCLDCGQSRKVEAVEELTPNGADCRPD